MLTTQSLDQIAQVKNNLQENEERFDHLLGLLEKWMDSHAFIPKHYNKGMLPICLRICKYDLNQTKQRLEWYFVYKKRYPEVFCFHEFNHAEKKGLDNFYVFESSKLTPSGYRVGFAGFHSPDATGCDMNVINKFLAMCGTYKANHDVISKGLIIIMNLKNLSPSILSGVWNPSSKRGLKILQKVYPFRLGGIYLTFMPKFAIPFTNMIKMIYNEKIRKLVRKLDKESLLGINITSPIFIQLISEKWSLLIVFIEAGNEHMKKNIPMYCLPKEFGGTDGTIKENTAKFIQTIMQAKPWFLEQEKIQIVGDIPKDLYEMSGIDENGTQGIFRQLKID